MNAVMTSRSVAARRAWPGLALLVVVSLALITVIDQLPKVMAPISAHAVARHGEDAVLAKQCLDEDPKPALMRFWNPLSRRWGVTCWLGDRWGIVILTTFGLVITSFVTTKLKTVERVRRYMERQGYEEQ